jgi:hypothetical protein
MIHKITCKKSLAKWNMQNTLRSDQASKQVWPSWLLCRTWMLATRATGSSTLTAFSPITPNSQSVFTDLIFNWTLHDCVVVQMMRFISLLGGSQNRGENWPDSQAGSHHEKWSGITHWW